MLCGGHALQCPSIHIHEWETMAEYPALGAQSVFGETFGTNNRAVYAPHNASEHICQFLLKEELLRISGELASGYNDGALGTVNDLEWDWK